MHNNTLRSRAAGFYPGWRVLTGSFVCAAIAVGFTTYIFGMFVLPVTTEFGVSRANFNNGMIAFLIGMGVLGPLVGNLLDRLPARLVVAAGGIAFGGALMLASRVSSLWLMLALIFIPLTFGATACGVLGANTIVVRWFQRRRGRALGILALSTSVGGFLAQPVTAFLIDAFGWRDALFLIGLGATAVFLLMAALLVRDRPRPDTAHIDREFDVSDAAAGSLTAASERSWSSRELFRNRNFWLLSIGIGMLFGIDQAVLVSQVPYFQDIGFDLKTTALLVSIKTISAIGGKLIVGFLADKVDLRLLFLYVAGSNALLLTIYMLQPSFWLLLAAVSLLGVAVGGVFPVWTTLIAWLFGARSYGTVMGLTTIIMQPFAVAALRFIGEVYDRTGSYVPAFGLFIALVITAIGLIWLLRPERVRTDSGENGTSATAL